jgi:hypothetical protein
MHISNDRYFRDRQRHDLALRMISHEARTHTIRSCTGLTDDRIRRLSKTFARHHSERTVRRHRGKSPRQIAYFTRSLQMQFEASCLSSLFAAFGLMQLQRGQPRDPGTQADTSIEYGERFCDAFETHCQLLDQAHMSIEHAWFLLQLLSRGASLRPTRCRQCSSRYLHDHMHAAARRCPFCELKSDPEPTAGACRKRRTPRVAGPPEQT